MSVDHEQLPITSPCPISLDQRGVSPQDRALFCAHCSKDVHLLSQMTEREARDHLRDHAGEDICVSYAIGGDGGIRFRPEPALVPVTSLASRVRPQPRRMSLAASIGAGLMLAACTPHSQPDIEAKADWPSVTDKQVEDEVEPCDPPIEDEPVHVVAGGISAEPLEPEVQADPPPPTPPPHEIVVERPPKQMARGGLRARPLPDDPLGEL